MSRGYGPCMSLTSHFDPRSDEVFHPKISGVAEQRSESRTALSLQTSQLIVSWQEGFWICDIAPIEVSVAGRLVIYFIGW